MLKQIKPGYKAIELSGDSANDILGNDLTGYFQYRTSLSEHRKYWLGSNAAQINAGQNTVIEIISQDLMEQDYSEALHGEPNGNVTYNNQTAYHENHGTAHGLRQREYQAQYLALVKEHGTPIYKEAANSLTAEEVELMKLAAYMHRLGRTNERNFQGDSRYGSRAAQIFKQVATELDFNSDLINSVAVTMTQFRSEQELELQDTKQEATPQTKGFNDVPVGTARQKAILFERFIEAGHITDLVRCGIQDGMQSKQKRICDRLKGIIEPSMDVAVIAQQFLMLACKLCEITGSDVAILQKPALQNRPLIVKAATQPLWTKKELATVALTFMYDNKLLSQTINSILDHYKQKIDDMVHHNKDAKAAALQLHMTLTTLSKDYEAEKLLNNNEAANHFTTRCKQAIETVMPTLDRDLGWGDYLRNMMKQMINIATKILTLRQFGGFFTLKISETTQATQNMGAALASVQLQ